MLTLNVTQFARDLEQATEPVFQRQIPFALANAINDTTLAIQQAVRGTVHAHAHVRRTTFIDSLVKVSKFAKKDDPTGEVGIRGPNSAPDRADLLTKFERGGRKTARGPHGLNLPTDEVRPTVDALIPKAKRPKALLANPARTRVFPLTTARGRPILVQRTGRKVGQKGRSHAKRGQGKLRGDDPNLDVLYTSVPSGQIPAFLGFYDTAAQELKQFAARFAKRFDEAKATAR
jgi:hypothetical protein